tara:strand:- start:2986 stop:3459 length:474 start_codon:yes stop_codon:yes gene_type:complete
MLCITCQAVDETTILNFRHLLERHALTEVIFAEVNAHLAEQGVTLRSGTLIDVTFIDAQSSAKNKAGDAGLSVPRQVTALCLHSLGNPQSIFRACPPPYSPVHPHGVIAGVSRLEQALIGAWWLFPDKMKERAHDEVSGPNIIGEQPWTIISDSTYQ